MSDKKFYCYKITNLVNGKIYIGKSVDAYTRFRKHKEISIRNISADRSLLHKAMRKYGIDNFKIDILSEHNDEQDALNQEQIFIKKFNSKNDTIGYNLTDGGEGSSGYRHPPEILEKMSKIQTGKKHTKETLVKMNSHPEKLISNRKLSDNDVVEIKKLLNYTDLTHKEIAEKYNVVRTVITRIKSGNRWKHIKI